MNRPNRMPPAALACLVLSGAAWAAVGALSAPEAADAAAMERLKHASWRVRLTAVKALSATRTAAAAGALIEAAGDPRNEVRQAARSAISDLPARPIDATAAALRHASAEVRLYAANALREYLKHGRNRGILAKDRGLKLFAAATGDADWRVRRTAARALGELEMPAETAPVLERLMLKDAHPLVRRAAVAAIGRPRPTNDAHRSRLLRLYTAGLKDADFAVRGECARWLVELAMGERLKAAPLAEVLRHGGVDVRRRIVAALGDVKDPAATRLLRMAVDDRNAEIRADAHRQLVLRGAPDDLPQEPKPAPLRYEQLPAFTEAKDAKTIARLLAALPELPSRTREEATRVFAAKMSPAKVEPMLRALTQALADGQVGAAAAAAEAFTRQADPRAVPLLIRLARAGDRRHHHTGLRKAAIAALGAIGDPRALPVLREMICDDDFKAGSGLANALAGIGPTPVADLIALYDLTSRDTRRAIVARADELAGAAGAQILCAALTDTDREAVATAAAGLARIGDRRAVEPLIALLRDAAGRSMRPGQRTGAGEAARALGLLADPRAVSPLIDALDSVNWSDRVQIAWAFARINDPTTAEKFAHRVGEFEIDYRGDILRAFLLLDPPVGTERLFSANPPPADRRPDQRRAFEPLVRAGARSLVRRKRAEALLPAVSDADHPHHLAAAVALASAGDARALPALKAALKKKPTAEIVAAVSAIDGPQARAVLLEALARPITAKTWRSALNARRYATKALAVRGEADALGAIFGSLSEVVAGRGFAGTESRFLQDSVRRAVRRLGGPKRVDALLTAHERYPKLRPFILRSAEDLDDPRILALRKAAARAALRAGTASVGDIELLGAEAVDELLKAIKQASGAKRAALVGQVARVRDPRAAGPLRKLLTSALAELVAAATRPSWQRAAGRDTMRLAENAILALSAIGDETARPLYLKAMGCPYGRISQVAAIALAGIGDEEARDVLHFAMHDPRLRRQAVRLLSEADDPAIQWRLLLLAHCGSDPADRAAALNGLKQIKGKQYVDVLRELLENRRTVGVARTQVLRELLAVAGPAETGLLIALYREDPKRDYKLRRQILDVLARRGDERALPLLAEPEALVLAPLPGSLRVAASGKIELIERVLGPDRRQQQCPWWRMARLVPAEAGERMAPLFVKHARSTWQRSKAAEALGYIRCPAAVTLLAEMLEDDDENVRGAAAVALSRHGDPRCREPLRRMVRRRQPLTWTAAEWLVELGDPQCLPLLGPLTRDDRADVRRRAVECLGLLGSKAVLELLGVAARDEDLNVRRSAAWALANIDDPAALKMLLKMTDDPSAEAEAALSLIAIDRPECLRPVLEHLYPQNARLHLRRAAAEGIRRPMAYLARVIDPATGDPQAITALRLLAEATTPASVDLLMKAYDDPPRDFHGGRDTDSARRIVVKALHRIGTPAAVEALRKILDVPKRKSVRERYFRFVDTQLIGLLETEMGLKLPVPSAARRVLRRAFPPSRRRR